MRDEGRMARKGPPRSTWPTRLTPSRAGSAMVTGTLRPMPRASGLPALVVRAPAKVNLTLEVVGKRPDGFHELRSVFAALALHDRLTVSPAPDLEIECDVPELASPANLAWRAADALRRDAGTRAGARLVLEKRIPIEAGLGGGSSDAAAALVALDALWGLGYPRSRLREIGATIGSDVPFFLGDSPLALVTGRGEVVMPVPVPPAVRAARFVLAKPPMGLGAGAVFRTYPPSRWAGTNDRTAAWMRAAAGAPAVVDLPRPLNDLEDCAIDLAPGVGAARDALLACGAAHAVMSGSGSTFFAVLDAASATRVRDRLRAMPATAGWFLAVTELASMPMRAIVSPSPAGETSGHGARPRRTGA